MEKNIVLVVREGLALRNDNGVVTTFTSVSSVESVLVGIKSTLESIQTNAQGLTQEFTHLYVPGLVGGLLGDLIGLYKRTGKTREGNVIGATELNLYIEVDQMLRDRSDNVRLVNLKHVRKNDLNMETLIKKTWMLLDREERKLLNQARVGAPVSVNAGTQQAAPSQEMLMMQQQMAAMQQMMQQMMQMNNMMNQMPMQQFAAATTNVMPNQEIVTTATVETNSAVNTNSVEGTPVVLDPSAILNATAPQVDSNSSVVTDYNPEF